MGRRAREARQRVLQAEAEKAEKAQRRMEDEIAARRGAAEPRLATEDISRRGESSRRLQLIVRPTFSNGGAWEVRETDEGGWLLFSSNVVGLWPTRLKGWWQLPSESLALKQFYERVSSLTLPLGPPLDQFGGLDGTITELAAFSGYSQYRFQWWSDYPPIWQPLVSIANEMLDFFAAAEKSFVDSNSPPVLS